MCSVSRGETNEYNTTRFKKGNVRKAFIVYLPVVTFYLLTANVLYILLRKKLTRRVVHISIDNSERCDINLE